MPDEASQQAGLEGVGMVKAWLESTTWMTLPMNAYEDADRCKVAYYGGSKKFDLSGYLHGPNKSRRNLWVECKRYNSHGGQHGEFMEFLAIAYSYTAKTIKEKGSCSDEFLWVTSHPFKTGEWPTLVSFAKIDAVMTDPAQSAKLGGDQYDPDLARELAERVWLLVWCEKQVNRLSLTREELGKVMATLKRDGEPLWSR